MAIIEINSNELAFKLVGKVLKSESYFVISNCRNILQTTENKCKNMVSAAQSQSNQIIDKANQQASSIQKEAEKKKEEETKKGYDDGYNQGKKDISDVMMEFVTKSANSFSKLESDVTEVIKIALRKIIGKIDKTELILLVVKNALQRIKTQKQATLKVCPEEAPMLRDRINELTKDTPVIEFLDIFADAHLKPGDCILETELGIIDASVNVQLESVENALTKIKS